MAKKPKPMKKGGGRPCLFVLAIMAAWIGAAAIYDVAHAQTEPLPKLSPQRFGLTAQTALQWERVTNVGAGAGRISSVSLVPNYRILIPTGGKGRNLSLAAPVQIGLDADHKVRFGAVLSYSLWNGADAALAKELLAK